ncbi:MAG TPA: sodium:proton exchanger [Pseudohongiella sp.]|nr:sodium:proton exchanger [Gammaproteobacteria bacterium]HBN15699.1 sodium:proton exchanger [Pseudohongiella sp.]|tara:strand:- start:1125 stop:2783 length:1659 start_codon:yes stop_codon:yes gene_type:complete
MGFENVFVEVAAMLAVVTIIGSVGLMLRQPLIVSFIAAGIILGPSVLGLVAATEPIELLAQMGIALLLFVVGLKLDLHIIRTMGTVALATGLGQVLFTSIFGFLIALALGMSPVGALYVGVALTFSSTIIIVKLLSDKKEIDALHGRIAVGFLIVQDIVVVLVMIGLTALGAGTSAEPGALATEMLWVVLKGTGMLLFIAALMKYVLPTLTGLMARSAELLILFAISWAVTMAAVGDALGFSKEVGAFLAGVSLASTPFREVIGARLVSLRDFLLLFFFIELGSGLELGTLGGQVAPALILSAFVLIGNPIIVMAVMGYMGYRKRTGFLAGLTVAQISEFSLILAALGLSLGHIDRETVGLITLVGLITISGSTYMILYSHRLYEWLSPAMSVFERRNAYRETEYDTDEALRPEFVVFGLGRYGCGIADQLMARGHKVLGIDIDPEVVRTQGSENMKVRFGDAEDPEFLGSLPLARTRWVINTARERDINMALLNSLRREAYVGKVALTAANARDAEILQRAGADLVLRPFADAAFQAVDWLLGSSESVQPS